MSSPPPAYSPSYSQRARTRGAAPDDQDDDTPHYRAVFEAAGVGIARVSLDGRLIEVNQRFADILGRRRDDLIGLHVQDITHPDDIAFDLTQLEGMLDGRIERQSRRKRYLRPDGQIVHAELNVVLLRDQHNRPSQFISVIEDASERMRMQEALGSARAAERASKAKTEFLSRMSHELRTPLNAMLGFAQLLRVDPRNPLNEAQRQKVEHIERAGAHLLAMMSDVLDLSRIEAGSLPMTVGALPVAAILDEAAALVSNQASHAQVQLTLNKPDAPLFVRGDQVRLRQVLVNLLSNAIKYNLPGGRVMLEALPVNEHIVFTVTDTGRGMRSEQLVHLFEPFNRLGAERTAIEGTGIGLVIVKRLLELMNGRVEVSSTEGKGSSFRVWLPQSAAPDQQGAITPTITRNPFAQVDEGAGHRTMLYAEDNVVNVEVMRQVMRMRPQWHLEVATSGLSAITMAQANPPDLLLLDIHLGDMSGLDVSDALAQNPATATIPRVALSADAMPDQIQQARERGFVDYLTKPLDVARFLSLLDSCGRHVRP